MVLQVETSHTCRAWTQVGTLPSDPPSHAASRYAISVCIPRKYQTSGPVASDVYNPETKKGTRVR